MAGLLSVPVLFAQFDDELICEVQPAENLQRGKPASVARVTGHYPQATGLYLATGS